MAFSSSKRNSASARESSVLPTPVGPRKMNEPIGRFSSCRPARARRTAFETASIASSWPMTRCIRRSSIFTSFSRSPSCKRETGMPRPARDDFRDVFLGHFFAEQLRFAALGFFRGQLGQLAFQLRDPAVLQLARRGQFAATLGPFQLGARGSSCSFSFRCSSSTAFFFLPLGFQSRGLLFQARPAPSPISSGAPCSRDPFPSSAPAVPSRAA